MPKGVTAPTPKEIRDAFAEFKDQWKEIQDEGQTDMRYVSGDPWDPQDRRQREDNNRPCISVDEINQYLNQTINNIRENKRAIQITPEGDGANDEKANLRQNQVRGIEYESNAQEAYITSFENAINRGYGVARLTTDFVADDSFNQKVKIKRIANPDTVIPNPDYRMADGSDIAEEFVLDVISKKKFKQKYPKAKISNFTGEHMIEAPGWIRHNMVQIAEFWKIHQIPRKLLRVRTKSIEEPFNLFEDELKQRDTNGRFRKALDGMQVVNERTVYTPKVMQYLTNGLEILDEKEWLGTRIPLLWCFGKELFVDEGDGAKRVLLSMVRLARDPQMLLAYYVTQAAEEAGQSPKAPFIGYKGQFESDIEAWETAQKVPHAFLQVDPTVDAATNEVLPLPIRQPFEPNFQTYQVAIDSARRAIQASMGIAALPTAAQRDTEKSGVALEKIQTAEAIGSFHFTDNYDRFLHNMGWQINELLPKIYDYTGEVPIRDAEGNHSTMRINDPAYEIQNPGKDHLNIVNEDGEEDGQFGVTVSSGPSYQSQREQASEFVDHIIANFAQFSEAIPPPIQAKILGLAITLKDVGPIGKKLADLLSPPDENELPPAAQAVVANLQAQVQQLTQENQGLLMEHAGKVLEQQTKVNIEKMRQDNENLREQITNDIKVLIAEIQTKAQAQSERNQMYQEFWMENHRSAHEVAKQQMQQGHEQAMASQTHQNAMDLADQNNRAAQAKQVLASQTKQG